MFNNNLKKTIATVIFVSVIMGTSVVTIIPAHALSKMPMVVNGTKFHDGIKIEQANTYCKRTEADIDEKNFDEAQKSLNNAYTLISDINNSIYTKQSLSNKLASLQEKIYEGQANEYLRRALLDINANDISKAHLDLITAFNYGNQISESEIRQPIVAMIIKVQNQITIWGR
jgi:hypothetical protein